MEHQQRRSPCRQGQKEVHQITPGGRQQNGHILDEPLGQEAASQGEPCKRQSAPAQPRMQPHAPAGGARDGVDHPHPEKEGSLGQPMVTGSDGNRGHRLGNSFGKQQGKAHPGGHEPHLADARIGENRFQVALGQSDHHAPERCQQSRTHEQ